MVIINTKYRSDHSHKSRFSKMSRSFHNLEFVAKQSTRIRDFCLNCATYFVLLCQLIPGLYRSKIVRWFHRNVETSGNGDAGLFMSWLHLNNHFQKSITWLDSTNLVNSLCFIFSQILLQCLSRTQNLAAHLMLLKEGC